MGESKKMGASSEERRKKVRKLAQWEKAEGEKAAPKKKAEGRS